jgi:hypothetical protein
MSFIKGGMSFIGIIGMNSRYEAEIQILTSQPHTNMKQQQQAINPLLMCEILITHSL